MLIGYARVSTVEQETDLQLDALHKAGVEKIYSEKTSAVSARPQLNKLLSELKIGDCLVVYKLDRLARSLKNLLAIIERLDEQKCSFKSLTEPIDNFTPAGMLMLQMLGAVAQFERSLIRERAMAGQAAAVARGVVMGRPPTLSYLQQPLLIELWQSGQHTIRGLASVFGIHESAVKRLVYRDSRHGLKTKEKRAKLCPV